MALPHDKRRGDFSAFQPKHFLWRMQGRVAVVTLNRPERKNPLTLESYAELRDMFRDLCYADDVKAVVIAGAGGNFCSGGDVHDIIGPLVRMQESGDMGGLLDFTRMTGDLVKAMRGCPQPIVAAVDGVCAGAGAILAMASDLRYGTPECKTAFLFVRVGLAGADMAPDAPRSFSTRDDRWAARKASAGASSTNSRPPTRYSPMPWRWRSRLPGVPPSRTE
jgi:enoyl-CoA hydratase/carnithine racemase